MNLEEIRVTPDVRQKYVLVRALHDGNDTLLLWGNPHLQWHKDIVDEITKAGYVVVEILGGGWMMPKPEEGIVYVWGKSDRYGLAPIYLVRELLKETIIEEEPA